MNRVYPLREGSGECDALDRFDAGRSGEFRHDREKICFQIISLLKRMSLPRHRLRLRLCRMGGRAARAGPPQKFRKTDSDATLAPLVFGTLKFSYSSRAPNMLMCA